MSYSSAATVILFDSSSSIKELKRLLLQSTPKIITFDYDTHKILSKNNIEHEISDTFVDRNDLRNIQKNSYNLVKWYNEAALSDMLNYDGINLGSLIQVEFNYFLVQFLKKFVEISQIFRKYTTANFVASDTLYDIIRSFTSLVIKLDTDANKDKFYYDTIKVTFKVKNHFFTLSLPKNYYIELRKTSERIIHLLFGPHTNSTHYSKSALLVEFDTIRYKEIFANLHNSVLNLILFNRRRPAIWNKESHSIIRKSKCNVATYYSIIDKNVISRIENGISLIKSNINSIWNDESFFETFFSINGISFWKILKPYLVELFNKRFIESIMEIELTKRLLEKYRFSSVLIWSEVGTTEQIVVKLAKRLHIPVVLIQHGLFYDTPGAYDMNFFQAAFPIDADKFIVWGKVEEQYALKCGVSSEKLEVMGSPLHDNIFKLSNPSQKFILLATSGPVKEDAYDLTVKTHEKNENSIKKICEIVTKLHKNLVIKLHPSPDEFDPSELVKEINPEIKVIKTGSISTLIQSCEVLIVIDVSTVILEAQILRKPVISISVKDNEWGNPEVYRSNSCIHTELDNFEASLKRLLEDEDFKKLAIENGKKFVDDYLSNQGSASEKLLDFLSKI